MIEASCHCGAIRLSVETAPTEAKACNCSICRRLGTICAYYPRAQVRFAEGNGPTDVYLWGDRMMEFHRCRTCGCHTHWLAVDPDYQRMGVNARMMDPQVLEQVRIEAFDGASM